ncbi:MAG: exosortase/archaeosortase family protein [Planctomycetota bacterium]|nr:exosortase/archaeosortase family protein [Planctomycetota bacterium]
MIIWSLAIFPVFAWSYANTWSGLYETWDREPDYSHGMLVAPLAAFFLWLRREKCPWHRIAPSAWGLLVLGLSLALRWTAARFSLDTVDAWSMIVWFAGWLWLTGGHRLVLWALPSLGFLLFMVPLPYRLESVLSVPLQNVATQLSSFLLQLLGQPAFAEGTTILLGDQPLQVEQACSGLRIFVGILALASATLILSEREWWERIILIFAVIPIALLANATRIVVTGLLYRHVSSEAARHFSHDVAGWIMIPLAASMFLATLWYLSRLMPVVEIVAVRKQRQKGRSTAARVSEPSADVVPSVSHNST